MCSGRKARRCPEDAVNGGSYTVVAELTGKAAPIRPYTLTAEEDASAFLAEVANSFVYLGCEVRAALAGSSAAHVLLACRSGVEDASTAGGRRSSTCR